MEHTVTNNSNSSNILKNNSNGSSSNNINGNSSNNNLHTQNKSNEGWQYQRVRQRRVAVVGTARPGAVGTKVMGAPPPSRHFVIKSVLGGQNISAGL